VACICRSRPTRGKLNRSWLFVFATGEIVVSKKSGKLRQVKRQMGLGPYPEVGLAEARQKAADARKLRREGKDPIDAKRAAAGAAAAAAAKAMTFNECAAAYIAAMQAGWTNSKHAWQWRTTLADVVAPVIGAVPVGLVDTAMVMRVLGPIWHEKTVTAKRISGRIETVLDWAKAHHYREGENPARWRGHLELLLPKPSKVTPVRHLPAMPYVELPAFMERLRNESGIAVRAIEFTILTATRTGEVMGVSAAEVRDGTWTVPAVRMKMRRERRVPLCTRAVAIIEAAQPRPDGRLFPITHAAMRLQLRRLNIANYTVHGFRSTFRDWAAESLS